MSARQKIEGLIEKKRQENAELQRQIEKNDTYIQGLLDSLRFLPKETNGEVKPESNLRPGSDVYKAREFLRQLGRPAYVMDIIKGIGKEENTANRVSLSGTMSWWVRKGQIFTRPKPNTFGLVEFESTSTDEAEKESDVTESES
jgi:hypothetical protein